MLIARRRKNENPVEAEALPLDDLKEFVDLYDEKNALLDELEETEEEEKRGVLRKEDRKRMRIVEAQLGTLSKKIGELKPEIRSASTQHANALRQMEVAEADMAAAKDGLKKVDAQIRAGQISREAYEKLRRTYQKRIGSAKGVVDSVIITFKEEVEAF
jgi:chromosome segregation ATPase